MFPCVACGAERVVEESFVRRERSVGGKHGHAGRVTLPHDARYQEMRCRILAAYMVE